MDYYTKRNRSVCSDMEIKQDIYLKKNSTAEKNSPNGFNIMVKAEKLLSKS